MSTYSFFQAHIQETLTGDSFMGHNTDNKVLPDCDTPVNANVEEELMTTEEKICSLFSMCSETFAPSHSNILESVFQNIPHLHSTFATPFRWRVYTIVLRAIVV